MCVSLQRLPALHTHQSQKPCAGLSSSLINHNGTIRPFTTDLKFIHVLLFAVGGLEDDVMQVFQSLIAPDFYGPG